MDRLSRHFGAFLLTVPFARLAALNPAAAAPPIGCRVPSGVGNRHRQHRPQAIHSEPSTASGARFPAARSVPTPPRRTSSSRRSAPKRWCSSRRHSAPSSELVAPIIVGRLAALPRMHDVQTRMPKERECRNQSAGHDYGRVGTRHAGRGCRRRQQRPRRGVAGNAACRRRGRGCVPPTWYRWPHAAPSVTRHAAHHQRSPHRHALGGRKRCDSVIPSDRRRCECGRPCRPGTRSERRGDTRSRRGSCSAFSVERQFRPRRSSYKRHARSRAVPRHVQLVLSSKQRRRCEPGPRRQRLRVHSNTRGSAAVGHDNRIGPLCEGHHVRSEWLDVPGSARRVGRVVPWAMRATRAQHVIVSIRADKSVPRSGEPPAARLRPRQRPLERPFVRERRHGRRRQQRT
jgi:hypothetical protein